MTKSKDEKKPKKEAKFRKERFSWKADDIEWVTKKTEKKSEPKKEVKESLSFFDYRMRKDGSSV